MKIEMVIRIFVIFLLVCLSACGGGGGGGSSQNSNSTSGTVTLAPSAPAVPNAPNVPNVPATGDAEYENLVQQLYVAYFGRPADPAGLAAQIKSFRAAGAPNTIADLSVAYANNAVVRDLVDSFASSAELTQLYYMGSNLGRGFVPAVYDNVFSDSPKAADADHWNSLLQDGHTTRASILLAILVSAQSSDADIFTRKVQAATLFTRSLDAAGQRAIFDNAIAKLVVAAMIRSVPSMPDDSAIQASIKVTMSRLSALSTGSFVEAAGGVRKILLLASAEQMVANGARVSALAGALTSDLNSLRPGGPTWTVTIKTAASTVTAIRDQLHSYHSAILIGRVPVATAQGVPRLDVYRLPDCPVLNVDVTGEVSSFSTAGLDLRCQNGLVISILRGRSAQTEVGDVGRKLDQMIKVDPSVKTLCQLI